MSVLIDISRPVHPEMVVYPGNPAVTLEQVEEAGRGKSALTQIMLGSHTGTHIDAPAHIVSGQAGTAVYDLERMNGPCEVIDAMAAEDVLTAANVPDVIGERVLFKTRNSLDEIDVFDEGFVALDESAAELLVQREVKLVGIDALSIKKRGKQDRVHEILLNAGVVILEGLWLAEVTAGNYELLCLPLHVDLDGAPVRAVLKQ